MKYAKLVNGELVFPPNPLLWGNRQVFNPGGDVLVLAGYKPVSDTPFPETPYDEEPKYYVSRFEETETEIVRVWDEAQPPELIVSPPTVEERVDRLEGQMADVEGAMSLLLSGETEGE